MSVIRVRTEHFGGGSVARRLAFAAVACIALVATATPAAAQPPPPGYELVETVPLTSIVAVEGGTIPSSIVLQAGVTYKLRASGTVRLNTSPGGWTLDAEYFWQGVNPGVFYDENGTFDAGVAINAPYTGLGLVVPPNWGPYNSSTHTYQVDFVGLGAPITFNVWDSAGAYGDNSSSDLQVQIFAPIPLVLNPPTLPNLPVGQPVPPGGFTVNGGCGPYTFAVTAGALPPALTLNPTTGVVSGTPTTPGPYNFTVTATDCNGNTVSRPYTLVVDPPGPVVVNPPPPLPTQPVNEPVPPTPFTATGGQCGPYTFAITAGALPAALTMDPTTGVVTGTPTAVGNYEFTVTATDCAGNTGFRAYTLTIAAPVPVLPPGALPALGVLLGGVAYLRMRRQAAKRS